MFDLPLRLYTVAVLARGCALFVRAFICFLTRGQASGNSCQHLPTCQRAASDWRSLQTKCEISGNRPFGAARG